MKNKRVYIRLIISYLIIFLLPMLMNVSILEDISNATQEKISQSVLVNLNHARDTIDNNFKEIDSIVEKLTGNQSVRYIAGQMDETDKLVEYSKIKSAQDFMEVLQIQTFVEEYYLFFHKSDMVISPEHVYLDAERLSWDFCYANMQWEEFREVLENYYSGDFFPEAITLQGKRNKEMILYVQSLVNNYGVKGSSER